MWDRGLHSYVMMESTIKQGCDYLGRVPANVKLSVEKDLDDGSYLSWINPDGKSKKKGGTKTQVQVIEYVSQYRIDLDDTRSFALGRTTVWRCSCSLLILRE